MTIKLAMIKIVFNCWAVNYNYLLKLIIIIKYNLNDDCEMENNRDFQEE